MDNKHYNGYHANAPEFAQTVLQNFLKGSGVGAVKRSTQNYRSHELTLATVGQPGNSI